MIDADMTEMDVVEIALTTAERLGQHALTWKRRLVEAEATIQRVRELHRPSRSTIWSHDLQQAITVTTCQQCGSDPYPCPTIKALDEGDSE